MPFCSVAIHNALCRSNCKPPITNLLLSNVGVMSVFQEPFTHFCSPNPWPEWKMPTHIVPSGARARSDIPLRPGLDFNPGNSYEVEEPGFHRTRAVSVPIRKYPRLSLINAAACGGTPSLGE